MFEFLKKKFGKKADASPSSPDKPEAKEPEKMAEPFFSDPYDYYGSYEYMDMQEGCPSQPTVENSKELGRERKSLKGFINLTQTVSICLSLKAIGYAQTHLIGI